MDGIQINYLSRWLGHSSIQTNLIYLELVPGRLGVLTGCHEHMEMAWCSAFILPNS